MDIKTMMRLLLVVARMKIGRRRTESALLNALADYIDLIVDELGEVLGRDASKFNVVLDVLREKIAERDDEPAVTTTVTTSPTSSPTSVVNACDKHVSRLHTAEGRIAHAERVALQNAMLARTFAWIARERARHATGEGPFSSREALLEWSRTVDCVCLSCYLDSCTTREREVWELDARDELIRAMRPKRDEKPS